MTIKKVDELAKKLSKLEHQKIDTQQFKNSIKELFLDKDSVEKAYENILKIHKESFFNNKGTFDIFYKTWEDEENVIKEFRDDVLNAIIDNDLDGLELYRGLIEYFLDNQEITDENIEICFHTYLPVLFIIFETEMELIIKVINNYVGEEIGQFIAVASFEKDNIDRRKLPRWVLGNYRNVITEIDRIITRAISIISKVENMIANAQVIEEDQDYVNPTEQQFKRAYTEYGETGEYSYSELSKALTTQKANSFNLVENTLGNVEIMLSGTAESQDVIKRLKPIEKKIIDIIVTYFKNGKREFTDEQLAREIYGNEDRENGIYTKPTKDQLDGINKAIEKIRTTLIEVKGQVKDNDILLNSRNPFVNLTHIGKKDANSNTQYYVIEGTPFYYTYIYRTGGKFIEYSNKNYTKKIEGIKKTEKAQSLRIYLLEKISNISLALESPYIDLKEIYNLDDVQATTSKQKFDTCYKVELILSELSKEYKVQFKPKTKGKTKIGYEIKL